MPVWNQYHIARAERPGVAPNCDRGLRSMYFPLDLLPAALDLVLTLVLVLKNTEEVVAGILS